MARGFDSSFGFLVAGGLEYSTKHISAPMPNGSFIDLRLNGSCVQSAALLGAQSTLVFSAHVDELLQNHTAYYGSAATTDRDGSSDTDGAANTDNSADGRFNTDVSRRRFFLYWAIQNPHYPLAVGGVAEAPSHHMDACARRGGITATSRWLFCALARQGDEALGNLTWTLHELGHENETLLLVFGDNGGAPRYGAHVCSCSPSQLSNGYRPPYRW
jgi:arylsulfatase A-like enzyme